MNSIFVHRSQIFIFMYIQRDTSLMQHNQCDQLVARMSLLSFIDLFMLELVDMVCEFSEGSF